MGDLSTQNAGLEALLKQVVDRMTAMDPKVDGIQEQLATSYSRADALEARLSSMVLPHTAAGTTMVTTEVDPSSGVVINGTPHPQHPSSSSREVAPPRPSASSSGLRSVDRDDAHLRRGDAIGLLGNLQHAPGTGTNPHQRASSQVHMNSVQYDREEMHEREENRGQSGYQSSPKMDFPKFDGENPKLWQQECETYFELYHVPPALRTRYASLNCKGTTALWLHNVESKGKLEEWGEMCQLVHEKFGKNKYVQYPRQLRQLQQTGSVAEFIEKFEKLRHQLLLYKPALDESFFIDEFIEGLKPEFRTAIRLQLPEDLDTANLLALLQEAELESISKTIIEKPFRSAPRTDEYLKDKASNKVDENK